MRGGVNVVKESVNVVKRGVNLVMPKNKRSLNLLSNSISLISLFKLKELVISINNISYYCNKRSYISSS